MMIIMVNRLELCHRAAHLARAGRHVLGNDHDDDDNDDDNVDNYKDTNDDESPEVRQGNLLSPASWLFCANIFEFFGSSLKSIMIILPQPPGVEIYLLYVHLQPQSPK